MTPELSRPELSRIVSLDRLPAALTVEATPAECTALATRLQIPEVKALTCRFQLRRIGHVVLAEATLAAKVVQTCVVSLDPVEQHVTESFTLRFIPEGTETEDDDPDSPDELPYAANAIDLGEAAAEQLALSLDPYPRAPDATLAPEAQDTTASPFTALTRLKP